MDYEKFEKEIIEWLYEAEKKIGLTKGSEYMQGDRFDHFKRIADETGVMPEQVLWIYLKKHLDSISYYVKHGKVESESLESRIVDARVYLSLLLGLERESQAKQLPSLSSEIEAKKKRDLYQQKIKEMVDLESDIDVEPETLPIFCVGCGARFEPDDIIDIFHIVQFNDEEFNAYYHHAELKSIDDHVVKEAKIIERKKASEIVNELDSRLVKKADTAIKKPRKNNDHAVSLEKIQKIIDIVKNSDKPLRACEVFERQNIYKSSVIPAILSRQEKKGVLIRDVDKAYSYNGGQNDV